MRERRSWQYLGMSVVGLLIAMVATPVAAAPSSSTNYRVTDTKFGAGSVVGGCSDNYCSQTSIGDLTSDGAQGPSNSANFTSGAGSDDHQPLLQVIVDRGMSNLGVLSDHETASKSMIVRVKSSLKDGYTVRIVGPAPSYNNHSLTAPTVPTASKAGVEQFGINAVYNTQPKIGADPTEQPSNHTASGLVEAGYDKPNLFQYIDGSTVASSNRPGEVSYTISMIFNISGDTPVGRYAGDYTAVVIPAF